jgi:hypothetical protein
MYFYLMFLFKDTMVQYTSSFRKNKMTNRTNSMTLHAGLVQLYFTVFKTMSDPRSEVQLNLGNPSHAAIFSAIQRFFDDMCPSRARPN